MTYFKNLREEPFPDLLQYKVIEGVKGSDRGPQRGAWGAGHAAVTASVTITSTRLRTIIITALFTARSILKEPPSGPRVRAPDEPTGLRDLIQVRETLRYL